MPATQPSPRTWTLRFKNNRTTILLHVDPLQKLSTVKSELLQAIQQTNPHSQLPGVPHTAEDIYLAKAVDINDLGAGWESIEPSDLDAEDRESAKGKGKAGQPKAKGNGKSAAADTPQGAGLRDSGIVAFRFHTEEDKRQLEAEENARREKLEVDDDDEMVAGVQGGQVEKWNVVVPTIEETYAENAPLEVPMSGEAG